MTNLRTEPAVSTPAAEQGAERIPAEVFHPSEFIKEELAARQWSVSDLAKRMDGDYGVNHLALEFYLEIGPDQPNLRMGDSAEKISVAFGCDPDFFGNLEKAWLKHPTTQQKVAEAAVIDMAHTVLDAWHRGEGDALDHALSELQTAMAGLDAATHLENCTSTDGKRGLPQT